MRIVRACFVGCLSLAALGTRLDAVAQPAWHNLEAGEHALGFRLLEEIDGTRIVPGPNDPARPVRIYLWYPAAPLPGVPPMRFDRYAALAEDDVWPVERVGPLRDRLHYSRHVLARSLGPEGYEALGRQPLRSVENAEPLPGPFPLIAIGQGLNYESPIAFVALSEYLAGRGFVVATCPLVGTDSPFWKLDVEDLASEVRDLEFVIARARDLPYVRPDKLGVMGFDMGGMAGLILSMRNPGVDAFSSLQSGILFPHPSGLPAASPDYDPSKLRIPWLHVSARGAAPTGAPAASLFESAVHSERYHLSIDGLQHVDSTSYALVEGRKAVLGFWSAWDAAGMERHELLSRFVSEFFSAFLRNSPESLAFLSGGSEPGPYAIEHRSATPLSMTYAQFVDALVTGDADGAMERIRDLRGIEPEHILLEDSTLYRLAYSLLYRWGLGDEALEVSKMNVELNPSSALAAQGLSMSYVDRGDYAAAIDVYRRFLARNPDDESARRTLQWLEGQLERSRSRN